MPIWLPVEADQNRHDLAQTQATLPPLLGSVTKEQLRPLGLKLLAEVINVAKQSV